MRLSGRTGRECAHNRFSEGASLSDQANQALTASCSIVIEAPAVSRKRFCIPSIPSRWYAEIYCHLIAQKRPLSASHELNMHFNAWCMSMHLFVCNTLCFLKSSAMLSAAQNPVHVTQFTLPEQTSVCPLLCIRAQKGIAPRVLRRFAPQTKQNILSHQDMPQKLPNQVRTQWILSI